jgi:hypothetical protein
MASIEKYQNKSYQRNTSQNTRRQLTAVLHTRGVSLNLTNTMQLTSSLLALIAAIVVSVTAVRASAVKA